MSKALDLMKEAVRILEENENNHCDCGCKNTKKLADVKIGQIFEINGNKYKVLDHFVNGETLIVSLDTMIDRIVFDDDSPDYKTSDLKDKIEKECLPIFEKDFGPDNIVEHEVALTTVDMQEDFGTVICKARPMTFDEARKYNNLLVNKDINGWYWTLTPWSIKSRGYSYSVAVVSPSGLINYCGCDLICRGVRPVCILKSNIFVSL